MNGHAWTERTTATGSRIQVCARCGMSKGFFRWMTKDRNNGWRQAKLGPVPMPCEGGKES